MKWVIFVFAFLGVQGCDWFYVKKEKFDFCENKVKELNQKIKDIEDRRWDLEKCLIDADKAKWSYVELNGRKLKNGVTYQADPHVWDHSEQIKRNAIEECRVRYK